MPQNTDMPQLLCDEDVAQIVSMSRSWVRKQRFLRRRGEAHTLTIDPVIIGSTPRYQERDVVAWIGALSNGGAIAQSNLASNPADEGGYDGHQ